MKVYNVGGWNWGKFKVEAPDYRNGDIFYVIYDNKIIAVKVSHSYLTILNSSKFCVCATFETPTKNTIFDAKGILYINNYNGKYIEIEVNNKCLPIYETIEDAKNNIKNERFIDISNYDIVNKGYEFAKVDSCGCNYYFELYHWGYYKESLRTTRFSKKITNLIWSDNMDSLLFSKEETPIPNGRWATESDVLAYLSERNKNMEVVSFNEEKEPKKEVRTFEMTLKVTTDMTTEEITKLISKQINKEKESAN